MAAAAASLAAYGATTLKLSSTPFGDDAHDVLVKVETPEPGLCHPNGPLCGRALTVGDPVHTFAAGTRCPTDIVCIVDVSGSMGTPVSAAVSDFVPVADAQKNCRKLAGSLPPSIF